MTASSFLRTTDWAPRLLKMPRSARRSDPTWPGVAPDSTRTFQPTKVANVAPQPWPTICPLTDEEIGMARIGGSYLPWDGVRGPSMVRYQGRPMVRYQDIDHTDYLETGPRMTAALTARLDAHELQARVLAMAYVYWALGIPREDNFTVYEDQLTAPDRIQYAKAEWSVFSFRKLGGQPIAELRQAEERTGTTLSGGYQYRFLLYRFGNQFPDPQDLRSVLVEMHEQVICYVDRLHIISRRDEGDWQVSTYHS